MRFRNPQSLFFFVVLLLVMTAGSLHGQLMGSSIDPFDFPKPGRSSAPAFDPMSSVVRKETGLGGAYLTGKGVPRDPVQSAYWYKQAADHGDAQAQNQMGYFCLWGIGVPLDEAEAFKWFTRAAGSGSQQAKLNMAVMILNGQGTRRDVHFALDLFTQLAQKGNTRAEGYLGILSMSGVGAPPDPAAAEQWFSKAAKGKNPEAEYMMGTLYCDIAGHQHDCARAAKLFRAAARAGYVPAMYALGALIERHPDVSAGSHLEAVALFNRAAEAGSWEASAALGFLARDGKEQPQDWIEAFRWLTIATRQGGAPAEDHTRLSITLCRQALAPEQQKRILEAAEDWLTQHPHADLYIFSKPRPPQFPADKIYALKEPGTAVQQPLSGVPPTP
jgi:hypothetical protein